jgi:acetylornithine/N-succinyldiaminopimelate aminotransferase
MPRFSYFSLTIQPRCEKPASSILKRTILMISSVLPTYSRAPLTFTKGEGAWLIEESGRRFLDFGAGIAVNALGHAHPKLVEAITNQAQNLWHVSNLYQIKEQKALADRLVDLTFADTVFFTNSGTESCELAVKMARKYWYEKGAENRVEIITFNGSFHGRSSAGIAAAGSEKMVKGFGPVLGGFVHVDFADHDALRAAVNENTAAILVEPVQGEGGIRPLPDQCLKGLRDLCDEHGILLILDEVQCGVGRTGRLFAHEWAGIEPDIMMVAKGIGGGFPLGAVLATENAASGMTAGTHGSTYGGNPLGCAVGLAVLNEVATPEFLDNVNRSAARLRQGLEGLVASYPEVFEGVRGQGLMLGILCKAPNTDVVAAAYDADMLVVPAADNVVRLLPPLNITEDDMNEALARLEIAAKTVQAKK